MTVLCLDNYKNICYIDPILNNDNSKYEIQKRTEKSPDH